MNEQEIKKAKEENCRIEEAVALLLDKAMSLSVADMLALVAVLMRRGYTVSR